MFQLYAGPGGIPFTPFWRSGNADDQQGSAWAHRRDARDEERFLALLQDTVWPVAPSLSEADRSLLRSMSFVERNPDGTRRWCGKCKAYQPDRTHHCSVCRKCALMMDHHCTVFGVCVGFSNYKFHFLTFVYAALTSFIGAVILLSAPAPYEDEYGRWITYPRWLLGLCNVVLVVLIVLYCKQRVACMRLGVTTLEHIEKMKTKNPAFQLALVKHRQRSIWRMCFGDGAWEWWNPYVTSRRAGDDGLFLPPVDAHRHRQHGLSGRGPRGRGRRGRRGGRGRRGRG